MLNNPIVFSLKRASPDRQVEVYKILALAHESFFLVFIFIFIFIFVLVFLFLATLINTSTLAIQKTAKGLNRLQHNYICLTCAVNISDRKYVSAKPSSTHHSSYCASLPFSIIQQCIIF